MGNCQAVDVAMVVIQHPDENKTERFYGPVKAQEIMSSNPGYYIVLEVASPSETSENGMSLIKKHKLVRPDDMLLIGHVYRLISFEDVLKEIDAKKCVKLRRPRHVEEQRHNSFQSDSQQSRLLGGGETFQVGGVARDLEGITVKAAPEGIGDLCYKALPRLELFEDRYSNIFFPPQSTEIIYSTKLDNRSYVEIK